MTLSHTKKVLPVLLQNVLVFAFLIFSRNAYSQWTQSSGPYGGSVWSVLSSGSTIYAGTFGGGIFMSNNDGASWTPLSSGLDFRDAIVLSMAADGSTLFAGFDKTGLFVSRNSGVSWSKVTSISSKTISSLTVNGSNIYAGTADGLFISTDNGISWSLVNAGLISVNSMLISGGNMFAGNQNGISKSSDNGITWTAVNSGLDNTYVNSLAQIGGTLFAGTNGGVFRSTNGSATWTSVNSGISNITILSLATSGPNLFAGTAGGGVNLSLDNGNSWAKVSTGLTYAQEGIHALAINGSNLFAGTYWGGVARSTNNGTSWTSVNNGIENISVNSIISNGNTMFATAGTTVTTSTGYEGLFLSNDGGASWTASSLTSFINPTALAVINGNIFCGGLPDGVYRSSDNGITWLSVNNYLNNNAITTLASSGNNLFAGTSFGGVYMSTNDGASWAFISNGLSGSSLYTNTVLPSETNILVGTGDGIYLSSDNGTSWAKTNSNFVLSMTSNGTTVYGGTHNGVILSTNNGSSWTAVNTGLTNKTITALTMSGNDVFAGTHDGVFYSTNNGTSWNHVGLSNTWIESLYVYNGVLFAGTTYLGIYSQPLSKFCSITSFTPAEIIGALVTINGTGFSTTASNNIVEFNGTLATVVNSTPTTLKVVVPSGATSGLITVTVNGGQKAISATNFAVIPNITSFNPSLGIIGSTVTISGTAFSATSTNNTVKFNGITAAINNATQTSLTVTVPPAATSGPITVSVEGQTGTSLTSFSVVPTISSFTPLSGIIGSTITIDGTGFSAIALNNVVQINGIPAVVSNATPTSLIAIVPPKTKSGPVSVSLGGQTVITANNFTVIPPTITSFTPTSGIIGSTVIVNGANFSTTTSIDTVRFNGRLASVTSATSTTLTVKVPVKTTTGPITVSVGGGQTISSTDNFTVIPPTITSFTPTSGIIGSTVIINGANFSANASIDTVRFNGRLAVVTNATSTALTVKVPFNATTGPITVSVGGSQTTSSMIAFCILPPKPTITPSNNSSGLILTSSSSSGNQWFLDGAVIANATSQTISVNDAGSYSVQVTAGTCQSVVSDSFVVTGDSAFPISKDQRIVLYPNPATHYLYISLENLQTGLPVNLEVFDILGHNLIEMTSQRDIINLDITNFDSGYYIVRINQSGSLYFGHFNKL